MAAIETDDLTKSYGRSRGIEGLTLAVEAGEVLGFLGPNGSGKTTAIRLIVDLIRPTRGSARVCGFDSRRESVQARSRLGYLPGELKLPERIKGAELLGHLARLRGGVGPAVIAELAERLELNLGRRIGELSKGDKQKVGVIVAFMNDVDALILDEPTSGLDPQRQRVVGELIAERAASGTAVLLSSHALDQVEHMAARVAILREGKLIALDSVQQLRRRAPRLVDIRLSRPVPLDCLAGTPGIRDLEVDGVTLRMRIEGSMGPLIEQLANLPVETLTSAEPDLDELFLALYGEIGTAIGHRGTEERP